MTYYFWRRTDKKFKKKAEECQEIACDFVESKLFELIKGVKLAKLVKGVPVVYERPPDTIACIFYLKTKGKKRGYAERDQDREESGRPSVQKFTVLGNDIFFK